MQSWKGPADETQGEADLQRDSTALDVLDSTPTLQIVDQSHAGTSLDPSDPWSILGRQLTSGQKRVLSVILTNGASSEMDRIARQSNTTTNLLVDSINEMALQLVGDNLIYTGDTTPTIDEDYIDAVRTLLHQHSD